MTLDEAIKHCEEKAKEIRKANEEMPTDCKLSEDLCECAEEHEQLAEWLRELKAYKEAPQGEWMYDGFCVTTSQYKCSVCRMPSLDRSKFCPNCGARMIKEADDEDK